MSFSHQQIRDISAKITEALDAKRLKPAFDAIASILVQTADYQLRERLADLETNYRTMLRYMTDGVNDPSQQRIYHDLLRQVWQVADLAVLEMKATSGWSVAYEYRAHLNRYYPESQQQLTRENDETKIFNSLRSTGLWNEEERRYWGEWLQNDLYPDSIRCLAIAAITLNSEELFDERKIDLLLEASENQNEEIAQRALTGLLLALRRYDSRLYLHPSIGNRLQTLAENPKFVRDIRNIIRQFILSRETEKLSRIMTEEIVPEMMKISPILNNKLKMEDLIGETDIDEKNPEWQTLIEESGIASRLREFSELQMEGADVMHSSFLHLKHFPFFSSMQNWFLPFNRNHPAIAEKNIEGMTAILAEATILCNSDKYSFFFSLDKMPEQYREMMTSQFSAETESIKEALKEEMNEGTEHGRIHPAARQYIQDLYRFYKLYPKRTNIDDIFAVRPEFYQVSSIAQFIATPDSKRAIAEYYFNRNYFEEAADLFSQLIDENEADDTLFQKRGYCSQMLGNIGKALDDYLKAELFNDNSTWTIKKIAWCYRALKRPDDALQYYLKAEKLSRDNLSLELNIGHCYLDMRQYDEALKRYFKVEYLSDEKKKEKAWRPLAWCSFLSGKYEQSLDYFNKIIAASPNATDYLNAGHACFALGRNRDAISHYASSLALLDGSFDRFFDAFKPDIPDLVKAGVKEADIPVILDGVMYGEANNNLL